jgi:hypothetical protein
MSFFSKLTKEFDELKAKFTDDDKPKEAEKPKESEKPKDSSQQTGTRGEQDSYYGGGAVGAPSHQAPSGPPASDHYSSAPPPPHQGQPSPYPPPAQSPYAGQPGAYSAPSPYGALPGQQSPYGAPPGQSSPYGAPPGQALYNAPQQGHYNPQQQGHQGGYNPQQQGQQQSYGSHQGDYNRGAPPPTPYGQPPGAPVCPPGWNAQYDQSSQRWYYVEHATGRTTWEVPSGAAVGGYGSAGNNPPPAGSDASRAAETGKKDSGGNKWVRHLSSLMLLMTCR